ncbi:MAG TPA: hypothetical protein VF715_03260 [Thermoleophilaceae bacterium]|jgi:hypothetical protein
MARRLIGLAAIAAALMAAAPAGAAGSASRPCRLPPAATVHAASSFATLYSVRKDERTIVRACLRRDGTRLELRDTGDELDSIEVADVTLAGRYAGWTEIWRTRYGDSRATASVFDLKKRRVRWGTVVAYRPAGEAPKVTDFALGKAGRAALVTQEHRIDYPNPDGTPSEARTVWAVDAGPSPRKLGEGLDIDLTSLSVSGFTATWTAGGQPRSAQLY